MPLTDEELQRVNQYIEDWWTAVRELAALGTRKPRDWKERLPQADIALMQRAAVEHPSGKIKKFALSILDHDANDVSAETFRLALADPMPSVRREALHGLACERCRVGELCTDDVVPALIQVLEHDDNASVRHASLFPLIGLVRRDDRILAAISRAAANDPDELVRRAATAARDGNYRGVKSRKAMRRAKRRGEGSDTRLQPTT
jgi:hypothetical protein